MNTYSSFVIKRTGVIKGFAGTNENVKIRNPLKTLADHLKYIGFRSKELTEKGFFDMNSDNADYRKFVKRIEENKALRHSMCIKAHKLMFALHEKDYKAFVRSGKDFKDIVRQTLEQYEKEYGVKLDWIANTHNKNRKNPHCHVVIKGVSDIKGDRGYTRIKFTGKDFKRMREIFRDNFEKDVKYKLHEKAELFLLKNKGEIARESKMFFMKNKNEAGRGIESFTRAFGNQVKKDKSKNEFEKRVQQRKDARIREMEEMQKKEKER